MLLCNPFKQRYNTDPGGNKETRFKSKSAANRLEFMSKDDFKKKLQQTLLKLCSVMSNSLHAVRKEQNITEMEKCYFEEKRNIASEIERTVESEQRETALTSLDKAVHLGHYRREQGPI